MMSYWAKPFGLKHFLKTMPSRFLVCLGCFLILLFLTRAQSTPAVADDGCASAEACFRQAVDFADSNPEQVLLHVERFRRVQEEYPGTIWARRAGFRIGWSLLERDPMQALPYLRAARQGVPLLEDYVLVKLGQALGRMGSARESALTFEAALEVDPTSALRRDAMYHAGFAWYEDGDCPHAAHHLRRATSDDPDSLHAPQALSVLADCAVQRQRTSEAQQWLLRIWWKYPESPEARRVNQLVQSDRSASLRWQPAVKDYARRAETFYDLARFEDAIQDLRTFLAENPSDTKRRFQLGMAHVRLKQYPHAARMFHQLSTTASPVAGEAAVWLAKVYLRQDQGRLLMRLRDAGPPGLGVDERARIQWLYGVWAEGENKIQEALTAYEGAARSAGDSKVTVEALWRLGWLQYQRGAWQDAVDSFDSVTAVSSARSWRNRAHYWQARTLERMGRDGEAQTLYQRVAAWPMTYYGQLAQRRLREPLPVGRAQRESWGTETMNVPDPSVLHTDVHFQKATELLTLGLRREAGGELSWVKTHYRARPQILYALALRMMEAGDDESALKIVRRHFRDRLARRQISADSPLWKMAYPTGYVNAIRRHSAQHVDPYLVAGIIREESLYNPTALSPVGAMGLMQLMPKTADRLARQLGLGSVDREDLFEGEFNVRLGVAYVGELLRIYEGNRIQAVAAYNAGRDAVERWIAKFGHRAPDEFVELISYKETRRYVKRVMTSYRIYLDLYATTCRALYLDTDC